MTSQDISSLDLLSVLRVDAPYRNTNNWKDPQDIFNKFFRFSDGKGVNNVAGFRPKSRIGGTRDICDSAFCLLVTNFGEPGWPDELDREKGLFTYYGDKKTPGGTINDTRVGGNRLLEDVFHKLHGGARAHVPPFLAFESLSAPDGMYMRFLGLACPGAQGMSALDDLVAVWRITDGMRFQNYRSKFTILRTSAVSHVWLEDLVKGTPAAESTHCPPEWQTWVKTGRYHPLLAEKQLRPRSKQDQLPKSSEEWAVLERLMSELNDREFEFAAGEILRLMDTRFGEIDVTPRVRDGGRDVIARYRVGHDSHQVSLVATAEAKLWKPSSGIGVKPMARLISRMRHRDLGVFITTSYFDQQVQEELLEDSHPVVLISGGDIARLIIAHELSHPTTFGQWLASIRAHSAGIEAVDPGMIGARPRTNS